MYFAPASAQLLQPAEQQPQQPQPQPQQQQQQLQQAVASAAVVAAQTAAPAIAMQQLKPRAQQQMAVVQLWVGARVRCAFGVGAVLATRFGASAAVVVQLASGGGIAYLNEQVELVDEATEEAAAAGGEGASALLPVGEGSAVAAVRQ